MQGFFNTGGRRESEPSRPKFVNPKTGKEQSWQRASNFAAPLESPFGLIKHQTRQLVRGINRRLDLARMLLTGAVEGEKIDEVISTALSAAEDEAKANNGTAVHAALGLCDTGRDVPQEYWPHAQNYVAELKRWGLRPVACEQRVLNTRLGATGTFDRVYVTDSGRYLIGDLKTGNLERAAHKFGVQLEVYAGADYLVHPNGTTEPIPWRIDQDAALIVHVDPDTGATSIYEVPLRVARWGASLAEQVRAFQRTDILLPYSGAPAGPLAAQFHAEASQAAALVGESEEVRSYFGDPTEREDAALGMDADDAAAVVGHIEQHPAAPSVVPQLEQSSVVAGVDLDQHAAAAAGPAKTIVQIGTPEYEARLAELMRPKNDKATLQRMLHDLGGRDLAHNRKWLAAEIIKAENSVGSTQQHVTASAAVLATTIEQGVPAAETTPFLLKKISEAASIEDLTAIRDNVIARTGPNAWSTAMDEVAAARAAELQAVTEKAPSLLDEIQAAASTQDLARIWNRTTDNGATPSLWTPELDNAARIRGAEIQAAQPPNPNPWGSA